MDFRLADLRRCFEGIIPAVIATCGRDGTPNVTYVSHVHWVDDGHVALSHQFFNKTRQNVVANPRVAVQLVDPVLGHVHRLALEYVRTESEGALFESLSARLDATAAITGMAGVFRLLGADVYRVLGVESVTGTVSKTDRKTAPIPADVVAVTSTLVAADGLDALVETVVEGVANRLGYGHCLLLLLDGAGERLFTIASRGYESSGVGSEVVLGEGIPGMVAERGRPIRVAEMSGELRYGRAVRRQLTESGGRPDREIPLPGLRDVQSVLAVPVVGAGRVRGVLAVESRRALRFDAEDEIALRLIADVLGPALLSVRTDDAEPAPGPAVAVATAPPAGARPVRIRFFETDESVFVGDEYLIKGVAGAILRKILDEHLREGRTDFSNRELRADPGLPLPALRDNLDARLVLLRRRMEEKLDFLRLEKSGRGRFRLVVERPFVLESVAAG